MRSQQERFFIWDGRARRVLTAGLGCLLLSVVGLAQQLQTPTLPTGLPSALPSALLPATASTGTSADDGRNALKTIVVSTSPNPNGILTGNQIIAIVQARPELIVDLKQVMADYLAQQGNPVQVDSITDDMLYRGIAADAGLRSAISIWLRARAM